MVKAKHELIFLICFYKYFPCKYLKLFLNQFSLLDNNAVFSHILTSVCKMNLNEMQHHSPPHSDFYQYNFYWQYLPHRKVNCHLSIFLKSKYNYSKWCWTDDSRDIRITSQNRYKRYKESITCYLLACNFNNNHIMVWIWRDLKDHVIPIPLL